MTGRAALVCVDMINEIVDPSGKVAGVGYVDFAARHGVLERVRQAQSSFRAAGCPVIHVRAGFAPGYPEHSERSPLFGPVKEYRIFELGTAGTEFAEAVAPVGDDPVVVKSRVSAFYGTPLETILRAQNVTTLYLVGVATDLGVESAARDAHDRDYDVVVLADCCIAATDEDHERGLASMAKFGRVQTLAESDFGGAEPEVAALRPSV